MLGNESNTELIESTDDEPSKKKARHSFTIEKKLEIVQYAKKFSNNAASKRYNAPRTCVIRWVDQEIDLKKMAR